MIAPITRALIGIVLLSACASGGPRVPLRTAALFPTLTPQSRCRLERPEKIHWERGHVVVVTLEGTRTIRRIIGLPGDNIAFVGEALFVNEAPASVTADGSARPCLAGASPRCQCLQGRERVGDRTYRVQNLAPPTGDLNTLDARCIPEPPPPPVTVPPGMVYLLADNRAAASDSRQLGPIAVEVLEARVIACQPAR